MLDVKEANKSGAVQSVSVEGNYRIILDILFLF